MSEEKKKRLKEYQQNYCEAKNIFHKCRYFNKSALKKLVSRRCFLFVLLLIF